MMKNYFKRIMLLLVVGSLLMISCSKEDDAAKEPITQVGGEVFRYQVVDVSLPDTNFSENEYQGSLGGVAVTLTKSEDNKLLFLVPSTTTLGAHTLIIPSLNNASVTYEVRETVLSGTPEEILVPLFDNLDRYAEKIDAASPDALVLQNNLAEFEKYYDNASFDDKKQIALAYQVNKTAIDKVILYDYSNETAKTRITYNDKIILLKFVASVALIDVGSWLAVSGGHPGVRVLGIVVAGIATNSAIDFYYKFIENEVKEIGISVGSILGTNSKNSTAAALTFQDNIASVLPITNLKRKLNTSDVGGTQSLLISFLKSKDAYNYVINKVNTAIQYVNDRNPFFKFKKFQLAVLPSSTTSVEFATTQEVFKNIKFSVSHSNLTLVSATLGDDGQLNIKIKTKSTPTTFPIEASLNYSYSDEFSSFSGTLPIKVVDRNLLIGTWKMESFDGGLLPGQYGNLYHDKCSSIIYEKYSISSQTMVFTENTFTENSSWGYILLNKAIDTEKCIVTLDSPDTQWFDTTSTNGAYTFINGVLEVSTQDGPFKTPVIFISDNKIKIDDDIFVRQ